MDGADETVVKAAWDKADQSQAENDANALKEAWGADTPPPPRILDTNEGLKDELARIQGLPEDERAAEMERLSKDLREMEGSDGLQRLTKMLVGDASGSGMLEGSVMER